jgi:hypothetical protein
MALNLTNLDAKTRALMVKEIDQDITATRLYMSPRLNELGHTQYPALLKEAAQNHDDTWFAGQIRAKGLLKIKESRRTPSGGTTTAKVPVTAPDTLAEGEFNRFYCRAVCLRAIDEGKHSVRVYRAKHVDNPRPESEAKIGTMVDAKKLLEDLRTSQGVEPALSIPPGPNSGLTVQLP